MSNSEMILPHWSEENQKDPKRQITGVLNKAHGEAWEKYIDAACSFYKRKGIAVIDKTPEPFHITRNLGKGIFQGYFEKAAQPDYKGILQDGESIIFEAKHTDRDRIVQNAVTSDQIEMLNDYAQMGAQCFVMVSFGLKEFYRVPWVIWRDMKKLYGHKYMNQEEIAPYRLKVSRGIVLILEGVVLKPEKSRL